MSKLEHKIQDYLARNGINFETQKPIPIESYPWQTKRSRTSPKCDIYLCDFDLYIEVKGFMTYCAVSKLSYLSKQDFKYYIFQGTESQWDPTIGTFLSLSNSNENPRMNLLDSNINHQIQELINLKNNMEFLNKVSEISLARLRSYITVKISEYKSWNGEWY